MKNNRKNRNLLFIRRKNYLRLGKNKFKTFFNVSNLMPENEIKDFVIKEASKELFEYYKLKLRNNKIEFGSISDNFFQETKIVKVSLFN